jgi:hypothetical protein
LTGDDTLMPACYAEGMPTDTLFGFDATWADRLMASVILKYTR